MGNKFCIFSKKGKRLSCHPTRQAALKRLRQIEFFKRQKGSLQDVISFRIHYGKDFEPDEFKGKSLKQWVAIAQERRSATTKQTVIIKKGEGCASTRAEATRRAKKHGVTKTIRETSTSFRFRQRPPGDFDQKSFRTIEISKCVTYVIGRLKGKK
jgi:hypothetical protein